LYGSSASCLAQGEVHWSEQRLRPPPRLTHALCLPRRQLSPLPTTTCRLFTYSPIWLYTIDGTRMGLYTCVTPLVSLTVEEASTQAKTICAEESTTSVLNFDTANGN